MRQRIDLQPKYVLDASAILALVFGEPGATTVEDVIETSITSAANYSEVLQKLMQHGRDFAEVDASLRATGLTVEPVLNQHAKAAALLWRRGSALSMTDRMCLSLGMHLELPVVTADQAMAIECPKGVAVELIR